MRPVWRSKKIRNKRQRMHIYYRGGVPFTPVPTYVSDGDSETVCDADSNRILAFVE